MASTGQTGTVTLNGVAVAEATSVQHNESMAVTAAPLAFGETAAPQFPGADTTSVAVSFRYTASAWSTIRAVKNARTAVALVQVPIAGTGTKTLTGNVYVTSLSRPYSADGVMMCDFACVNSDGTAFAETPTVTMTPAAGALAAQVGVAATAATFVATGGTGTLSYALAGHVPGLSLNTSSGLYNGTPVSSSQGTYKIDITATFASGGTLTQAYTVVVAAA